MPTAMSNVSASADAKIALFSGVSDSDGLSISGNGDTAKMGLKATNDNGKSNRVSDFHLTADNVLSTEVGDKVTVKDNVDFTKAVVTDARNNQKAIGITSNGVIDFAGYAQGVYTLDVVVDDDRAYEAIIAIGEQTNQVVDKEITRVNSEYTIEFVFPPIEDPKPPKCNEGEKLIDGKCEPQFDSCGCPVGENCPAMVCDPPIDPIGLPYCDLVSDDYKGGCHDRQDYSDDTGLAPCRDGSHVEDYRDCKDAGKHPDEQLKRTIAEPVPPAYCDAFGVECAPPGHRDIPIVEPEPIVLPEEPPEEIIPIEEELPEEEELGEDSDVSEGDEDSGSDDNEGSEESGGSEGETSE